MFLMLSPSPLVVVHAIKTVVTFVSRFIWANCFEAVHVHHTNIPIFLLTKTCRHLTIEMQPQSHLYNFLNTETKSIHVHVVVV